MEIKLIIRVVTIFLFIVSIISYYSCSINSKKIIKKYPDLVESLRPDTTSYIFKECDSKGDCIALFDCYNDFFFHSTMLDYSTQQTAINYFDFGRLIDCTVYVFKNDSVRKEKADLCLYNFCLESHKKWINTDRTAMPIGNLDNYKLKNWNSKRAIQAFILLMSKNSHDSMGHGDCTNVGVKFYFNIVQPKIKSIDGLDPNIFIASHILWDNETNERDCYDAFYNALYPLIKKAWEDDKIVLLSDENNK
ncbi:MAG: hypothetical protein IPM26_06440 [Saprospiraceae bacterium]|nr:hypothetical protein [Saprospiraceae bacterium]